MGSRRFRIALFLVCGLALAAALYVATQAIDTLARLDVVEQERDQWQRPSEIVQALNLNDGAIVVDLGSGAGYFTLKLSPLVGSRGRVIAVDLRKMSLAFLWIRKVLGSHHNVTVVLGDAGDPHLPPRVDAVLIVNTYHELADPKSILQHVRQSLVSGGRLVIADRGPEMGAHGLPMPLVEEEVRQAGFEVARTDNHFLDQPGEGSWWLLVARKN